MGKGKWKGTPEAMLPKMEGPFRAQKARPSTTAVRVRNRKSEVRVEEPLMKMMDEVSRQLGVSDGRLEAALGIPIDRIKTMRHEDHAWTGLIIARKALALMGYDLRFKVVKVASVDKSVILTKTQKRLKDVEKITGRKGKWEARKMWAWLGMDSLEEKDVD